MQTYRIQKIFNDGNLDIAVISASNVIIGLLRSDSAHSYYGHIQPVWLVVHNSKKSIAINMQADCVGVDELYDTVPELKEYIRNIS